MTRTAGASRAMIDMIEITRPAPAMSHFIVSMPSLGFNDRPPESNVTPLPTSAIVGTLRAAPAGM